MERFTNLYLHKLLPEEKPFLRSEGGGLYIKVNPKGQKTWLYIYSFDGKRRWFRLGVWPQTTLAEVRILKDEASANVGRGIDVAYERISERKSRIKAPTIEQLASLFVEEYSKPKKKSWMEDERQLRVYVAPLWGQRKAKDVTRQDVRHLLKEIAKRAPIQSNRVLATVRKMFNYAIEESILDQNPCANVKPIAGENRRDRTLSETELRTFWVALDSTTMTDDLKRALRLILVTAQRPGEVTASKWEEIDGSWWTIPAERSKNKLPHRVFLTPLAMDLLGDAGEGFVFPSPVQGQHVHINALSRAMRRNLERLGIADLKPHDLRRTAASHMTGIGVPRLTVSKILNHAEPGVTAVYDRHSYDAEKRKSLTKWSNQIEVILNRIEDNKIVSLL